MADVRVGQQATTADGRNVGFYHTLATVCGLAQCCPWSHGVVERLVPQRRSLALALVLTLLSDAILPLWPLGDLAACSSLQGRARLEASPSKTAIYTGDRVHVCDGCGRPWREEASWTDYQCMLHPMSIPMSSSKPALLLTTTHSVTRWRAGIARCAADTSVLEQCATYRCHHCLTPTRLLLGGSSWYYGGANICGGTGAIFSTCMTGRNDRRAHLCRIHVAASAPSGRAGLLDRQIFCWPAVLRRCAVGACRSSSNANGQVQDMQGRPRLSTERLARCKQTCDWQALPRSMSEGCSI
jgi:hypothetical protein